MNKRILSVSERIRLIRLECRMTQQQLADKVGLGREQIVRIEKGQRKPHVDDVAKFADALNTSCDYLLADKQPGNRMVIAALGLDNTAVERLSDLATLSRIDDTKIKSPDDYRRYKIAKRAEETLGAISLLASNETGLEIARLISAFVGADFSSGLGHSQDEKGNDVMNWSEKITEIEFMPNQDGSGNSITLPVKLMEACLLSEIESKIRTLKEAERLKNGKKSTTNLTIKNTTDPKNEF